MTDLSPADRKMILYWIHECEATAEAKLRSGKGDKGKTWRKRARILRRLLEDTKETE